ncbi:MAG: hypothetical protein QHH13_03690 [Melioribacter sp.]|uniref:hypothetical protein n=1 Tax=Rosettibacter primus TaxID=3111523 RepID=UPI00247E4832|nr:hypothetical protein [Melioribacter sp.]
MLTKIKLLTSYLVIISIILSGTIFISCESTKTAPIVPAPPTPVTSPAPLVLTGYVKDAVTLAGIQSATVILANENGDILTTLATDGSGKYQYDVTNIPGAKLNISASAASYSAKRVVATLNKSNYTSTVPVAYLTKITGTTQNVVAASGGQVNNSSTESVSGRPLTLQIPANALSQNTSITVSSISVNNAVSLPASLNKMIASAGNFEPTGLRFLQPVTVSFPLPYTTTPGKQLTLFKLNPNTIIWENQGTAIVDADGKSATAQLTGFSSWCVTDNGTFTQTSFNDTQADATEQTVPNGQTVQHSYTPIVNVIQKTGDLSDTWIRNIIGSIDAFSAYDYRLNSQGQIQPVTITYTATPQPDLPNEYKKDLDGDGNLDHYNPNAPNERGTWVWSAVVQRFLVSISGIVTIGDQSAQVTVNFKVYKKVRNNWTWVKKHDQGIGG